MAETSQNLLIVLASYLLMFLYVGTNIGQFPHRVFSGFALGLGGILIVLSSFLCSVGLLAYLDMGLTMISAEVVPFLILAIGVDNMFILKGAFDRSTGTTEAKLAQTLQQVGPSITIAAICEIIAFAVGALTKMPALQTFCLQSAFAVLIDFVLQLTVFLVLLKEDEQRKANNRLDILCCLTAGHQEDYLPKERIRKVFEDRIFPFLESRASSFIIFPLVLVILAASVVGGVRLAPGLNEQVSMQYGSDLYNYFTAYKQQIEVGPPAYVVMTGFDFTDEGDKQRIKAISDGLSSLETVQPPVYSWIGVF